MLNAQSAREYCEGAMRAWGLTPVFDSARFVREDGVDCIQVVMQALHEGRMEVYDWMVWIDHGELYGEC